MSASAALSPCPTCRVTLFSNCGFRLSTSSQRPSPCPSVDFCRLSRPNPTSRQSSVQIELQGQCITIQPTRGSRTTLRRTQDTTRPPSAISTLMPSLKRPADDSILPLRAPKHRKTTAQHPNGENSSPSQLEGLASRWKVALTEVRGALSETMKYGFTHIGRILGCEYLINPEGLYHGTLDTVGKRSDANEVEEGPQQPQGPDANDHSSIPSPPPSPPRKPSASIGHALPPRPPIPFPTSRIEPSIPVVTNPANEPGPKQADISRPNGRPKAAPTHSKYPPIQTNAVASTSRETLPGGSGGARDGKVSGIPAADPKSSGLMSPPSTQASSASVIENVSETYPDVARVLKEERRRRSGERKAAYTHRPHIYAKQVSLTRFTPAARMLIWITA